MEKNPRQSTSSYATTPVHAAKRKERAEDRFRGMPPAELDPRSLAALRFKHVNEFYEDFPDSVYN
jgi:hypothetical protein